MLSITPLIYLIQLCSSSKPSTVQQITKNPFILSRAINTQEIVPLTLMHVHLTTPTVTTRKYKMGSITEGLHIHCQWKMIYTIQLCVLYLEANSSFGKGYGNTSNFLGTT